MRCLVRSALALSSGPVARGAILGMTIRMAGLGISFVQAVLAARILGAQGYGITSVILSAVHVAATVATLGLGPLAVRELAKYGTANNPCPIAAFMHSSARLVAGMALAIGGALSAAALSGFAPEPYSRALLVGGLIVLPLALLQLQRGIAQGLGRVAAAQMPGELYRPGLFVGLLGIAAATSIPLTPPGYLCAFAASSLAALVMSVPITLRGVPTIRSAAPPVDQYARWRIEARPFLGMALVGILLGEINTLMLGWLATPEEAALFQPVARIAPLMILPAQVFAVAFAPRVAHLWSLGERARVERLTHQFTLVTSAMTLLIAGTLIFAAPLVFRAFGNEFLPSASLVWIIGLAQLVSAAAGPVGHLLSMTGIPATALRGQLAALTVNLLLGFALIPLLGTQGAVIAMAAGIVAWNLAPLRQVRRRLQIDPSLPSALLITLIRR